MAGPDSSQGGSRPRWSSQQPAALTSRLSSRDGPSKLQAWALLNGLWVKECLPVCQAEPADCSYSFVLPTSNGTLLPSLYLPANSASVNNCAMSYVIVRKPFNLRGLFPCLQNGLQCMQRERYASHISAVEHLVFSRCLLISSPFEFGVEYRT